MINSYEELAITIQSAAEANPAELEKWEDIAYEAGSQAWMSHSSGEELDPVVSHLKGTLKEAFLTGLSDVINAPNNQDSMIAANLRPYVKAALLEPSI